MPSGYLPGGKPDLGFWNDELRAGIEFRKREAFENRWSLWRQMYRGEWRGDVLPHNIFFSMLRTLVPRVYFRNPGVSVQSTKPGVPFRAFAKILERADNKLIVQMRLKDQIKRMVQDTFLKGTAVGKVGFGAQYSYALGEGPAEAPLADRGKSRIEYADYVVPNMPWFARTHPAAYIVPHNLTEHRYARWSSTIVRRDVEDVKADKRLSRARKDVAAGYFEDNFTRRRSGAKRKRKGGLQEVDLVELRDKKTGKVIVYAPESGGGIELFSGQDDLMAHGFPEYPLVFSDDSEYFWGIPDAQILEPYQLELNEIRTQAMYQRRVALVKWLIDKNLMDEEEIKKLLSDTPSAVARTNGSPRGKIEQVSGNSLAVLQALEIASDHIEQDTRESLGFGRNQQGEFRPGSEAATAAEAQIVRAASEIRVDERRDKVADLIVDVIEGIHNVIFRHWDAEQVIDVVGPGGVQLWVTFQPSMLRLGQYNLKVDPDTAIPETRATREARAIRTYEILKTNPMIDPVQLTSFLLHEMHGVAFDDMMRAIPGLGNAPNGPINPLQYAELLQGQIANSNLDTDRLIATAGGTA